MKRGCAYEGVSFMLADNAMDIHLARLSIWPLVSFTAARHQQEHCLAGRSLVAGVTCAYLIAPLLP